MKRLVIVVIVLAVILGGIALSRKSSVTVVNNEPQVIEKEVTVPELDKRVTEALTASSTEIEAAMQKASQKAKEAIESEIKLNVNRKMQAELKEQESKLEETISL